MSATFNPVNAHETSVAEQSRKNLQDKLNGLGGVSGRKLDPEAKAKKLREACEGFESIFIQKMWQEMRNTVPKTGMLQSREERYWQDMYDQELAKSMTKAGGVGLADMMYEQLSRGLGDASRAAAGSAAGGAFTPEAAPLIPAPIQTPVIEVAEAETGEETLPEPAAPRAKAATAAFAYDGEAPQVAEGAEEVAAQTQPVIPPVAVNPAPVEEKAAARNAEKPARVKAPRKTEKTRDNGIDLAYQARREAGDKLGSRAVRPALKTRKEHAAAAVIQPLTAPTQGAPGTLEALKAAAAQARDASVNHEIEGDSRSMSDLVARLQGAAQGAPVQTAQAENASVPPLTATEQTGATQTADAAPIVRRTRYTTNAPKKNSSQKGSDAIRMLNVDNVGVNSKAGKGIAAYHAAQEAAGQAPRTAATGAEEARPVFDIPPLTSADLLG